MRLDEHFTSDRLDPAVWVPAYLPRESSMAEALPIDVAEFHTYAVDRRPGSLEFSVDAAPVQRIKQAPDHPVQLEIGVFDFPDRGPATDVVPELVVSHVIGRP